MMERLWAAWMRLTGPLVDLIIRTRPWKPPNDGRRASMPWLIEPDGTVHPDKGRRIVLKGKT